MSDLTRYHHRITHEPEMRGCGCTSDMEPLPGRGEWVKAEEAEARIAKLQRRNKALSEALDAALYERSVEVRRVDAAQARLRAADELADAVKVWEHGDVAFSRPASTVPEPVRQALTAYREAGK